jgi:hypothetical protein
VVTVRPLMLFVNWYMYQYQPDTVAVQLLEFRISPTCENEDEDEDSISIMRPAGVTGRHILIYDVGKPAIPRLRDYIVEYQRIK